MKQIPGLILILLTLYAFSACNAKNDGTKNTLPALHVIPYAEGTDTLNDAEGADAFDHSLDHGNSAYYVINDYYNLKSGNGLHILTGFETYQQTTEYSCGAASALMVLNYFGNHDFSELEICRLAETSATNGTSVEGLAKFFQDAGWKTESHSGTDLCFKSITEAKTFIISRIDKGIPIMVDWEDWSGHWQVIIGIDTCGTDDPYDDVLIMADPYDVTDHYQDGYYTVPFGRFFYMWREGPCAQKTEPYEQPFVTAIPAGCRAI